MEASIKEEERVVQWKGMGKGGGKDEREVL